MFFTTPRQCGAFRDGAPLVNAHSRHFHDLTLAFD
jgi:hypothetical protein